MTTSRIHNDIRTIADISRTVYKGYVTDARKNTTLKAQIPIVRVILTLSNDCRESVIRCGRNGANDLIRYARKAMVRAAGSDGSMPMMITFHPTSSSRPWIKSPHVEVFAVWCDVGDTEVTPLAWSDNGPLDVNKLREEWTGIYPGSVQFDAHFFKYNPDKDCYLRDK